MKVGYARVSTEDQNLDMQRRALRRVGCRRIFEDRVSGVAKKRAGLEKALARLRRGDVLIVWRLDRLGRSLPGLIDVLHHLAERGVEFRSLSENIDTTTAGGRLVFHLMGALAEFERALIAERTKEGLAAARQRGAQLGRQKVISGPMLRIAQRRLSRGESAAIIARSLGVGRSTLYRALRSRRG